MLFQPGNKANPKGRPKGSLGGRATVLADLDRIVKLTKNRAGFCAAMQEAIDKDPLGFFRTYVMPLLPKEGKVAVAHDGIVKWGSLLSTNVTRSAPLPTVLPVVDDVPTLFAFPADMMDAYVRALFACPVDEAGLQVATWFALSAHAADTNVAALGLLLFPPVPDVVDCLFLPDAEPLFLDPLLEVEPWPTECVLWNLHHDASDALRVGNTNRFHTLQVMYWRLMAVSKARKITTKK